MSFSISFNSSENEHVCEGSIILGANLETFDANLGNFSQHQYEQQWLSAIETALVLRKTTALFQSIELGNDGVGRIWVYPIVPSEFAGDTPEKRQRLCDFPECENDGVYLSERFMPVTVKSENFNRRIYEQYDDGTQGDELSLFFLDLSAPERIFGYLDDNLADVSHWFFPNSDLETFLSDQRPL